MSKLKVKIITHTPNPDEVISCAGKLCYSKVGVEEISQKQSQEDIDRFVNMLSSMGHESPLEHCSFTFAVEGISRACSHQIVRHRIASFSQQSQRYVNLENTFEYITPPSMEDVIWIKQKYIKAMENTFDSYCEITKDLLLYKIYNYLVEEKGIYSPDIQQDEDFMINIMKTEHKNKFNQFEKEAIEDARYILPNACETKMVFTMNGRSLLNFLKHRECKRAQWEIRELASEMRNQLIEVAPALFKLSGAACRNGKCPEGKMTCGNPYTK